MSVACAFVFVRIRAVFGCGDVLSVLSVCVVKRRRPARNDRLHYWLGKKYNKKNDGEGVGDYIYIYIKE